MAQNGLLALLPPSYHAVMKKLNIRGEVFGVEIDDSPVLRDLVRLAGGIREEVIREEVIRSVDTTPQRVAERITLLVLGNLAGTFTFNDRRLETGAKFPDTLGVLETQRWLVGLRTAEAIAELRARFPGFHGKSTARLLSTQIRARVGDCAVYAITLGILIASVDISNAVILVGKPPHAWVRCESLGLKPKHIDLAARSHGAIEDQAHYEAEFARAPIKIDL